MPSLRELIASFDIDVDEGALKQADEHIKGFVKVLKEAGEVVAEAFATEKLREFLEAQIQAGAELKITSERLGVAVEELQALELAANQAGVSTESLTTGLRFLNRNISEAIHGSGEHAKAFGQLHIALKNADGSTRNASDVMGELADKIAAIPDAARQTDVAMTLLGRHGASLIPLLKQGGQAFEEARKQMEELGGGMSEEFVESAHAAEAANVRLTFAMSGLKSQIAAALFPAFSQLVSWFTHLTADLVRFNKETHVLSQGLAFLGVFAAVKAISGLKDLIPVVEKLTTRLILADVTIFGLEVPLLLVIGLAGLLFLAFNELYTLMTGGESVIGDTIDELFGIGTATQLVGYLKEGFSDFLDLLKDVGPIIWRVLVFPLREVIDAAKGIVAALGDIKNGQFGKAWEDLSKSGEKMLEDLQKLGPSSKELGDIADDVSLSKADRDKKRQEAQDDARIAAGLGPGEATGVREVSPEARHLVEHNIYGREIAEGIGGVHLHQTNTTKVDVHTGSDQPKAVGDATAQGVADAHERNTQKAKTALRQP